MQTQGDNLMERFFQDKKYLCVKYHLVLCTKLPNTYYININCTHVLCTECIKYSSLLMYLILSFIHFDHIVI